MKPLSRLCFLVLVISSLSRGQNETTDEPFNEATEDLTNHLTSAPLSDDEATDDNVNSTTSPSPQSHTAVNATDPPPQGSPTQETIAPRDDQRDSVTVTVSATTKEVKASTAAKTIAPTSVPKSGKGGESVDVTTTVSTTKGSSLSKPATTDHSSWGYVVLVMIILVIIALCVILYVLRRVSRTYTFDLQRPVPVNHLDEPIGTFEPVYLDDLDQPAPRDEVSTEESPPAPAANGTTVQSEENGSTGENGTTPNQVPPASEDQPDYKRDSLLQKFAYLYEDEQQNENNNNPSVCSSDPFVEINLDDPARCDQLLTSPEAPSSVLPFSPFSFSTSS